MIEAADRAVADLKASLQGRAQRLRQAADRPALTDRHRKEDQQFDRAVTARAELDRAAEIEARRAQAHTRPTADARPRARPRHSSSC
jgi:hypothetical protein